VITGFEYPPGCHTRRHGPDGYNSYESYRDWLRDEFLFRCVYCLHREVWYGRSTVFHIEHSRPASSGPKSKCNYENLLYACGTCNEAKRAILGVPDPCSVAFRDCLSMLPDGHVAALNKYGQKLILTLQLDNKENVEWRGRWIRILNRLKTDDPALYRECMSFPQNLPDLRTKKAPRNTKPMSVENCFFVQREKGVLPETY
jgi:HNH endonuclease